MPMGEYKDFADCVSKNKSKDDPSAYCGYIKHQIEGGKKKEEALSDCPECHEAFHLEEEIKREEGYPEDKVDIQWSSSSVAPPPEDTTLTPDQIAYLDSLGKGEEAGKKGWTSSKTGGEKDVCPHGYGDFGSYCPICDKEFVERLDKSMTEEAHKTRYGLEMCPHGLPSTDCPRCSVGGLPEPEILGEASAFVDTLKATIDEVTLMAKDTGYHDVSEKVSPTKPTYMYEVNKEMADVVVKQAKGFGTQVNWFNTVIDELDDIRKSAEKFFTDAGWNSKDTIKQYKEHMKKNGADWM